MAYMDDVVIDESALDVELLNQPTLCAKYGQILADAVNTHNQLKEKMEYEKALLDRDIRETPEKYGISKLTETVVQNTIILQQMYQDLTIEILDAKYELDMCKVAVSAIETRKNSIDNLIKLHGMSYFAGPSIPRNLTKEWAEKERIKKTDAGVANALKRTRK